MIIYILIIQLILLISEIQHSKEQKKTEEVNIEAEMKKIFNFDSDFSDEDPTYIPEDLQLAPTLSDSDDSQLITLDELLNDDVNNTKQEKLRSARSRFSVW